MLKRIHACLLFGAAVVMAFYGIAMAFSTIGAVVAAVLDFSADILPALLMILAAGGLFALAVLAVAKWFFIEARAQWRNQDREGPADGGGKASRRPSVWNSTLSALFVLVVGVGGGAVVFGTYSDIEVRQVVGEGVGYGLIASNRLWRHHRDHGRWPENVDELLAEPRKKAPKQIAEIRAANEGLVQVHFRAPRSIAGAVVEMELSSKDGKPFRKCRATGIENRHLPANCRSGSEPVEVREENPQPQCGPDFPAGPCK